MVEDAVRAALLEDWGRAGDITAQATLGPDTRARAVIAARQPGVLAGLDLAATAFRLADPSISVEMHLEDGARLTPGDVAMRIIGPEAGTRDLSSEEEVMPRCGPVEAVSTCGHAP